MSKMLLYHYTDKEGAKGIKESRVILGSTDHTPKKHRRFGKGVYFTSINPTQRPKDILLNNYDDFGNVLNSKRLWAKVEWVVEVYLPKDDVEKVTESNRDVYLFEGDVVLDKYKYEIYKNPNA